MEQVEKRKVGRPRKAEEEKKTKKISLYLPEDEYKMIFDIAVSQNLTQSDWLKLAIENMLDKNSFFSKNELGLSDLQIDQFGREMYFEEVNEIQKIKPYPFDNEKICFKCRDFVLVPFVLDYMDICNHSEYIEFGDEDSQLSDNFLGGVGDYAFVVEVSKLHICLSEIYNKNSMEHKLKEVMICSLIKSAEGKSYFYRAKNKTKEFFIFSFSSIDRMMNNVLAQQLRANFQNKWFYQNKEQ